MKRGKGKAPFKPENSLAERRYEKAREACERAEVRMVRAMVRWQNLRALLKRYDKRAENGRGELDWTDPNINPPVDPELNDALPEDPADEAQAAIERGEVGPVMKPSTGLPGVRSWASRGAKVRRKRKGV